MTGRLHHLWTALLPLVLAGCGADEGPRDGRPAAPTNVSVSVAQGWGEVRPEDRVEWGARGEIGVAYRYSVAALGEASAADAATTAEAVTAGSGVSGSVGTDMVPLYDQPELAVGLFTYLSQEE